MCVCVCVCVIRGAHGAKAPFVIERKVRAFHRVSRVSYKI